MQIVTYTFVTTSFETSAILENKVKQLRMIPAFQAIITICFSSLVAFRSFAFMESNDILLQHKYRNCIANDITKHGKLI